MANPLPDATATHTDVETWYLARYTHRRADRVSFAEVCVMSERFTAQDARTLLDA